MLSSLFNISRGRMWNQSGKIGILLIGVIVFFAVGVLVLGGLFLAGVSFYNKHVGMKTTFDAQTLANKVTYDKVWKVISQAANITETAADKFAEIYERIMDARYDDKDQVLMNFVQEQNPNFSTKMFEDLILQMSALRAEFEMTQKKLIDINREHDLLIQKFPNNIMAMILGIKPFEVKLVTSSRTEKAFDTGKDDDVKIFKDKPVTPVEPKQTSSVTPEQQQENIQKMQSVSGMATTAGIMKSTMTNQPMPQVTK